MVEEPAAIEPKYENVVGQDDLTRFDDQFKKPQKKGKKRPPKQNKTQPESGNKTKNAKQKPHRNKE